MSPMLWFASLPERVLRGPRAKACSTLAELPRARAVHNSVQPPIAFFISPSFSPNQEQTYVLAALYELADAILGEQAVGFRFAGARTAKVPKQNVPSRSYESSVLMPGSGSGRLFL